MNPDLEEWSSRSADDLIRFTQQLIRIPSFSLHEGDVASLVLDRFKTLAYDLAFQDSAGNVVGLVVGSDEGPTVLLASHMDTVRPANEGAWTADPFSGHIDRGRIHGLGAADCKGGLSAQIFAGNAVNKARLPLKGALVVAATVAEENGCSVGTRHLMQKTLPRLGLKPDLAILGEPTALQLLNGHDGWVDADITVRDEEPLAVRRIAEAILQDFRCSAAHTGTNAGKHTIDIFEPQYRSRGAITEAVIKICRRVSFGESSREIIAGLFHRAGTAIEPYQELPVSVEFHCEKQRLFTGTIADVVCQTAPWRIDPRGSRFDRARETLLAAGLECNQITDCELARLRMGSSGSALVNDFGVPTIGYGPGEMEAAHAPNESIRIDALNRAVYGTAMLALNCIDEFEPRFGTDRGDYRRR